MQAFVQLGWAVTSKGNEAQSFYEQVKSWIINGSYFIINKKARDQQFYNFFAEGNEEKTLEVV